MERLESQQNKEGGKIFSNFEEFYEVAHRSSAIRIYGKRILDGELIDDPASFVDGRFHKLNENYANLNFFKDGKPIAVYRLTRNNISSHRIEILI